MATTIIRTPEAFQPSLSDGLFFTVSADTTTQPKFRYVYEVYINGFLVFEGKSTPNPYGLGVIDLQRILDNYTVNYPVSYYETTPIFTHQTGVFSRPYSNEVVEYFVKVGEEYADSNLSSVTGFTGVGNQQGFPGVSSTINKSFLSSLGVNRNSVLENFNTGQFTLSGNPSPDFPYTTNCLFLTNSPRIRELHTYEYYTLSFTNADLGGNFLSEPYYVRYRFYDEDGTIIAINDYANITSNGGGPLSSCTQDYYTTTFQDTTNFNILNVGAGPMNIPNFPNNTKYYQVQLYGLATPPVPSPSPTSTPTPTPSVTPGLSPTPTPTPSSTPATTCTCFTFQIENFVGFPVEVAYTDCNGLAQTLYVSSFSIFSICACSVTDPGYGVDITNIGSCVIPRPTPTPTRTSGLPPEPTPSSSPTSNYKVFVRDCCTSTQSQQVYVDNNLLVGNVIVISGQCWEIYAIGGDGSDGDYRGVTNYVVCNECIAYNPCLVESVNPAVVQPNVQPTTFTPTGGTAPCVEYVPVSEIFQFNVSTDCNQFGNEQMMFKNRYGAWDYFLFTRARIEGVGITRETYGQYNTTWGSNNPMKTNYSRGLTDFQVGMTETHICNSGFLSQPEFVWLEELYTSNDVYLIKEDGNIFPINIIQSEFVRKTKGNRQIVNIELTYTYSNNIKLLNG